MKLRLDTAQCVGHALCHATDPDLFPIDDDGYSSIRAVQIGDGEVERARHGVNACPERALMLDE